MAEENHIDILWHNKATRAITASITGCHSNEKGFLYSCLWENSSETTNDMIKAALEWKTTDLKEKERERTEPVK